MASSKAFTKKVNKIGNWNESQQGCTLNQDPSIMASIKPA